MKLIAVNDKIVAIQIKEEIKTEGGIILMEESTNNALPQVLCEVVSVGDEVPFDLKQGDRFYTHANSGQVIAMGRKPEDWYKVFTYQEIFCLVEEDCDCGPGDACDGCP